MAFHVFLGAVIALDVRAVHCSVMLVEFTPYKSIGADRD